MRVIIADDEISVRAALGLILMEEPEISDILEVANLGDLINTLKNQPVDLILLDWDLSGMPSAQYIDQDGMPHRSARGEKLRNVLVASMRQFNTHPHIIVMSSWPEARQGCISAGVDAFVFKGDPPERLLEAIRAVYPRRYSETP